MDISLNGNDTITLSQNGNPYLLTRFFDKDYGLLNFPNEIATYKLGKGASTAVIAASAMGRLGELTLRILLASVDDAYINSVQQQFFQDAPSFALLTGQIVRRSGDGTGNVRNVIYHLFGGTPIAIPESRSNADGDEEQGAAVWKFKFAKGARQLM